MHEIVLNGYTAHNSNSRCLHFGTAESYGIEQIHITPGADWENLLIKATFHPPSGDSVVVLLGEDGVIDVPPEATAVAAGEYNPGLIVFSGISDGVQRISADIAYTVLGHAPVDGKDSEPTPSQWEQLAAQYQSKVDKQQGSENAGKFLAVGENGEVALSEGVKPEQIAAAVDAYLDENPIEAGATKEEAAQIRQNKTDIETLQKDKLSASELDSAIDSALAQAKASGEFDGKDGDPFTYEDFTEEQLNALKGEPGKDYVLTEADKQEIAQEAANKVKIPTTLPNPNALTFTGAVSGTYDGSEAKEIHIPENKEYTLPAASETALGGVKASAKTEDMTQPVGIGEDGFLFTAPGASGGEGETAADVQLAAGTLVSGTAASTFTDTGVSLETLRQYKRFVFVWKGVSNTSLNNTLLQFDAKVLYKHDILRVSDGGAYFGFEWLDSGKKLLRNYMYGGGNPSIVGRIGSEIIKNTCVNPSTARVAFGTNSIGLFDASGLSADATLHLVNTAAPTIDYNWEIRGLTI